MLVLERADHPGFWQSVTGSKDRVDEPLDGDVPARGLEETGIDVERARLVRLAAFEPFEIYPHWRSRYPEGVTHNTEHVFGLLVPAPVPVRIAPREHLRYEWLPWEQAAERCFSWTNVQAIRELPARSAACRNKPPAP